MDMLDKKTILKNFSIGFIPIIIFIITDELFGTEIGLIAAISVGILEFLYYYIRDGKFETFVAFDVGLIIVMGCTSILLDNALFFKLKPALIEVILAILLGVHAFSNKPLLMHFSKRYFKDIQFQEYQLKLMRSLSRLLFVVVLIHTVLIVYAALWLTKEAWAFISGGLFYIIFGLILLGQFVYLKYIKLPIEHAAVDGNEEWFDVVNPDGKIVGKAPRSAVHGNPKLLHPVIHLHVFNKNGQLYLQKRSKNKDVQPGKWDTSVGGHIISGEDIDTALKREAIEELGIKSENFQLLYRYIMRNDFESELIYTFKIIYNGPFKINKSEIEYGRFWRLSEIERNLKTEIFTPNFEQEFLMLKKILHKKK